MRRQPEGQHVTELSDDDVRAALAVALDGLHGGPTSLMGAGSDDVEQARAYLRALAPGGWAVPSWPREFGGQNAPSDEVARVGRLLTEFPRPDLYPFMVGLFLVGPTVLTYGSAEQKHRWLASIAIGEDIWCQMLSEPGAGSDLANASTRARRDGDGWRLSGQKVWTSRGAYATRGMCLTRTEPNLPKHQGLTMFAVPMDAAGVDVRVLRQMNGDQHFSEVFLDDVYVADAERIGQVGEGWKITVTVLAHERSQMQGGGSRTGAPLDGALPTWLSELADSGALADQSLLDRAMRGYIDELLFHLTEERASANARTDNTPGPEWSGQKIRAAAGYRQRAELIKDAQGLGGMLTTTPGHIEYLTAPSMSIRGGTDEIQRNIIGERVLGLPQEPRVDRDIPWSQSHYGTDGDPLSIEPEGLPPTEHSPGDG